ncbi:ABC transporter ATP-binding protein [soil metagenome]
MKATLQIKDLNVSLAAKPVLQRLSLDLAAGEVVSVIGAPGCGKSTLLRASVGLLPIASGSIVHDGVDLTHASVQQRLKNGIAFAAQGGRVFRSLSVAENIDIACAGCVQAGVEADASIAYEMFPRLAERRSQVASSLSGGERQMLALGMAMVSKPRLLLLDEPSGGLSPVSTDIVLGQLRLFRERHAASVLVVEQNIRNATALSERIVVLERGVIGFDERVVSEQDVRRLVDYCAFATAS